VPVHHIAMGSVAPNQSPILGMPLEVGRASAGLTALVSMAPVADRAGMGSGMVLEADLTHMALLEVGRAQASSMARAGSPVGMTRQMGPSLAGMSPQAG